MSVSDLTGTTWIIRDDAVNGLSSINSTYTLNFSSNSNNYSSLKLYGTSGIPSDGKYNISYNTTQVYGGGSGWDEKTYRIISITGGTDATNSILIAWLEANATQVPVTDLTDTEWLFNDNLSITTLDDHTYSISFTSGSINNTSLDINYSSGVGGSSISYNSLVVYQDGFGGWLDNSYKTISITGGTDVANPDLIVWLTNNASQVQPQPTTTSNMKLGSDTIDKVYFGSSEVSKVYLGSNVIYEAGGGAPDNAILDSSGGYIMASDGYLTTTEVSGYTVTVTNDYGSDAILYDGQDNTSINLGTIAFLETKTVTITSGYICATNLYNNIIYGGNFYDSDDTAGYYPLGNPCSITSEVSLYFKSGGGSND